jgi:hypothetical protein
MSGVFMSQSDAFRAMFSRNFKEGKDKKVTIEDIPADTMEALIYWMYTGKLVAEQEVENLFVVADRYLVSELKVNSLYKF